MVPLFKFYFHDGVRSAAAESMPHLLECAQIKGEQYVFEMWNYICSDLIKAIDSEPEQEVLAELMRSFSKVNFGAFFFTYASFVTFYKIAKLYNKKIVRRFYGSQSPQRRTNDLSNKDIR
jgi:hypothetical protein